MFRSTERSRRRPFFVCADIQNVIVFIIAMETSVDSLQFYVKFATGLLLLLNVALLVSIRLGMGWAKRLTSGLPDVEREVAWRKASRALGLLIVVVIAMNAAAIFANYHLRHAADAVVGENASIVLNQASKSH